jgi:Rad3-related DNA helicase
MSLPFPYSILKPTEWQLFNAPTKPFYTQSIDDYWATYDCDDILSLKVIMARQFFNRTDFDNDRDSMQYDTREEMLDVYDDYKDGINAFFMEQEVLHEMFADQLEKTNRIYVGPDFTNVVITIMWIYPGLHSTYFSNNYKLYKNKIKKYIRDGGFNLNVFFGDHDIINTIIKEYNTIPIKRRVHCNINHYYGFIYYIGFLNTPFTSYASDWNKILKQYSDPRKLGGDPYSLSLSIYKYKYGQSTNNYDKIVITKMPEYIEFTPLNIQNFKTLIASLHPEFITNLNVNLTACKKYIDDIQAILRWTPNNFKPKADDYSFNSPIFSPYNTKGWLNLIAHNFANSPSTSSFAHKIGQRDDKKLTHLTQKANTNFNVIQRVSHANPIKISPNVTINFAYPKLNIVQEVYAAPLYMAITTYSPMVIVAPTGSGKTLGTIYIVLNAIADMKGQQYIDWQSSVKDQNGNYKIIKKKLPTNQRIIVVTRTVQQAQQWVSQLAGVHPQIFSIVIGYNMAKFRYCINQEWLNIYEGIKKLPENVIIAQFERFCHAASDDFYNQTQDPKHKKQSVNQCTYFFNSYNQNTTGNWSIPTIHVQNYANADYLSKHACIDIEDLKTYCIDECHCCPYILNKHRLQHANVIVETYSYISDIVNSPVNGIVIADEAHNMGSILSSINECIINPESLQGTINLINNGTIQLPKFQYLLTVLSQLSQLFTPLPIKHIEQVNFHHMSEIGRSKTDFEFSPTFVPLDKALVYLGLSISQLYDLLFEIRLVYITYHNNCGKYLLELRDLVGLATCLYRYFSCEETVSSWCIYADRRGYTYNITYQDKLYSNFIALRFRNVDSNRIFTALKNRYNNLICLTGTYDNHHVALIQMSYLFSRTSLDKRNRITNFIVPDVHVSSYSNIIVSQVSCSLNDNQTELKFSAYSSFNGELEYNSLNAISDHLIQELLITSKSVLVFTQNKTIAAKLHEHITEKYRHNRIDSFNPMSIVELPANIREVTYLLDKGTNTVKLTNALNKSSKRYCIISYARSSISEGMNIPNNNISAIIIPGVPYENNQSKEHLMRIHYFKRMALLDRKNWVDKSKKCHHIPENELCDFSTWMEKLVYDNESKQAALQCIGRSLRNQDSRSHLVFMDSRFKPSIYYAKWMREPYVTLTPECKDLYTLKSMYEKVKAMNL